MKNSWDDAKIIMIFIYKSLFLLLSTGTGKHNSLILILMLIVQQLQLDEHLDDDDIISLHSINFIIILYNITSFSPLLYLTIRWQSII